MKKRFEEILNQLQINVYMTDIHTHEILFMNQKMKDDYHLEEPEGKLCWQLLQQDFSGPCEFCKVPELVRQGKENQLISWMEDNQQMGRTFENYDSLVNWNGQIVHMQQSYDITNILKLSANASRDILCGVWNREKGKAMLSECIENLEAGHSWMATLLDVDDLKAINEAYGHMEGDFLLQTICHIIGERLTGSDFMFRLSGDEFVVVLKDVTEKEGTQLLRECRTLVEQEKDRCQKPYEMSYSFGVIMIREKGNGGVGEYLALADEKMYEEKLRRRKTSLLSGTPVSLEEKMGETDRDQMDFPAGLLYDALTQSTDDYIYLCNMKTGVFRYSPAQVREFGMPGQVMENPLAFWKQVVHPDDWEQFYKSNMEISENKRDAHSVEFRARKQNGEYVWIKCRGFLTRDSYGEPSLFAGIMTPMGRKNKVDPLTQLLNGSEFRSRIQQGVDEEGVEQMGVMILDVDDFRKFNEMYDRERGDEILQMIVSSIQNLLPGNGSLYRLDNDRLGVILENVSRREIHDFYKSIQSMLGVALRFGNQKLHVTLSAGSAIYPTDGGSEEELFRYADYAVQYAKKEGKDRITFFDPRILKNKIRSLEISRMLRESISRNYEGFYLNYQPQVDAETGRTIGVEALMRWKDPDGQTVSPVEFIPIMEENGMIREATVWMMETALQDGREWLKYQPDFSVSVNISAPQMVDKNFLKELTGVLFRTGFPSRNLIVELTESCAVQNMDIFRERFEELRAMGVRVAMDDFGTGYSSLGRLKNAPVDVVKIDREFVKNVLVSSFDATFISFVVSMCHDVGIKVCLEGVETEEEYQFLKPMNLDSIQGYYFGRPTSAEEITLRVQGENGKTLEPQ